MRVGIIGSGIAGLSAAWLLTLRGHEVHLYEKQESFGLGAHSVDVGTYGDVVDVPIRFFHEGFYPELLSLFKFVGIETMLASLSPSIQTFGQDCHFAISNVIAGDYAIPFIKPWDLLKNLPSYATMLKDLLRFKRASSNMRNNKAIRISLSQLSLAQYLVEHSYSKDFTDMFLIPCFAVVTTSSAQNVREYPITVVMDYMTTLISCKTTRRMTTGTRTAGLTLAKDVKVKHTSVNVRRIQPNRDDNGKLLNIAVYADGLPVVNFDHVIIATQANQAHTLLPESHADHVKVLNSFQYVWSEVVVHSDERLMPLYRSNWSLSNIFIQPNCPETKLCKDLSKSNAQNRIDGNALCKDNSDDPRGIIIRACGDNIRDTNEKELPDCSSGGAIMCTIWQNKSQPLKLNNQPDGGFPVFQTWNPWVQPRREKVLPNGYHYFERPVVTTDTEKALERLEAIQGHDNIWFIGAYALHGVPLLENGADSGLMIAEKLTGQRRPWTRPPTPCGDETQKVIKKNWILNVICVVLPLILLFVCLVLYTR